MYLRGKWSFPDLGSYLLCAVTKEVIMNFKSVTVDHCQLVYRHALGKNFKLHYRIHKMALSGWYMVQKYAKLMPFIKNESVKKYFQDFEKILADIFLTFLTFPAYEERWIPVPVSSKWIWQNLLLWIQESPELYFSNAIWFQCDQNCSTSRLKFGRFIFLNWAGDLF